MVKKGGLFDSFLYLVALFVQICIWLFFALSPTLLGLAGGFFLCARMRGSTAGVVVWVLLTVAGAILGVVLAEKIRRSYGLMHTASRLIAHPELEDPNLCRYCGHDLTEHEGDTCPECGSRYDRGER